MRFNDKIRTIFLHPSKALDILCWKIANRHVRKEVSHRFKQLKERFPRDHYAWMTITDEFSYQIFCLQEHNLVQFVKTHLQNPIETVIEIGSASDLFLKNINANKKIGVNVLDVCVEQLNKQGIEGRLSSGKVIPADCEEADAVICLQTLEHVEDPIGFLKNINRVLKKDGVLILSIPWVVKTNIRDYLYGCAQPQQPVSEYHIFEFDDNDFARIAHHAGFSVVSSATLRNYNVGLDPITKLCVMKHFALDYFPAVQAYVLRKKI